MLNSREELVALRKELAKAYGAEKQRVIVCAGAGCVSKGALKVYA